MIYNLQLVYEKLLHYYDESSIETRTIYESLFNSYIIYHPTEDEALNYNICESILDVIKQDIIDNGNGYVIDILPVNDKIEVNIINQQNVYENLMNVPVDQVEDLGKMIFSEIWKILIKNRWLVHQDYLTNFYSKVDKYITYERICCKSSISLKYVSCSKKMTHIEDKIIEAANLFLSLQLMDYMENPNPNSHHCTAIYLERKSTHPIITGTVRDYLGYHKRIVINLKNIKNRNKVKCIVKELEKNYGIIYNKAEDCYKRCITKEYGELKWN